MYLVSHIRRKEDLKLTLIEKPRTPEEREQNRETLLIADGIRYKREQERLKGEKGYSVAPKCNNVFDFFNTYIAGYEQKDRRNVILALHRFQDFIRAKYTQLAQKKTAREIDEIETAWKEAHKGINGKHDLNENEKYRFFLKPGQITPAMVTRFVSYLQEHSEGSGAHTAFARFKKMIKAGTEQGIFAVNPCAGIVCSNGDGGLKKDVLTGEEIERLINTKYKGQNPEIRRAFITTLFTGVRFCDIVNLTFANVDYAGNVLRFEQSKTKGHSKHSFVEIPIRGDLLYIIGRPEDFGRGINDYIFELPSHTMCLKGLRVWTEKAGISKHITWHCGRHSFATNLLTGGANVKVVSELLGHSDLQMVNVYVHAISDAKREAVKSLPQIKL